MAAARLQPVSDVEVAFAISGAAGIDLHIGQHLVAHVATGMDCGSPRGYFGLSASASMAANDGYTGAMRSRLADDLRADTRRDVARLSPAARIDLAFRIGEDDLALLMAARGIDREEARRVVARSRQVGRRFSRVASIDEL